MGASSPQDTRTNARLPGMQVLVRCVVPLGRDINSYEVIDPANTELLPFEAGSHIDVLIPSEDDLGVRQYSLCGDPQDRSRYVFAVQREVNGRGGSKAIFDRLTPGSQVTISHPRNNFPLRPGARRHLLLAGGIGVTPMMSMLHQMRRQGDDFILHYCARSLERTAFIEILQPLAAEGRAFLHWDGGDPDNGLDLKTLLKERDDGTHLYYCGPPGFMSAVAAASEHWPLGTTHCEYFSPSAGASRYVASSSSAESQTNSGGFGPPFQVKIASTGEVYDVPSDQSLLNVLRDHGFDIETQCELGVCGSCRTGYLHGEPDHRDFVLEPDEHKRLMTVCCSRSKSPLLVLAL